MPELAQHLGLAWRQLRKHTVLAALEAYGSDPEELACWKDAAAALASAYSRARLDGAARIRDCFETGGLPPMTSLIVLSTLGDVDFAFTVARFMPLARDIGLVDYWRNCGHWPDFCATAAYDGKKEAARLAVH
jgi:hypothetical protein